MGTDHQCVNDYAVQGESSEMSEVQLCRWFGFRDTANTMSGGATGFRRIGHALL